jgi:DNA-binding MarR family transcriptional regulator
MQSHVRRQLRNLSGLADTSGIQLLSLIRLVTNLCDAIESRRSDECGLSGPRWGLLLRLMAEEEHGNQEGITPTSLSRYQSVSKNTISALLRGLEHQGLAQRALDPADYRLFRIQLTPAARELIQSTAPQRIECLNRMVSGLSEEERGQLMPLLGKLYLSLLATSDMSRTEFQGG